MSKGPNKIAQIGMYVGIGAAALFIISVILSFIPYVGGLISCCSFPLIILGSLTAIVLGIIGLVKSKELGGKTESIVAIAVGAGVLLLYVAIIIIVILLLGAYFAFLGFLFSNLIYF